MNTGQVLLIIVALDILSFVVLAVNSTLLHKTTTILQSEAHLIATSLVGSFYEMRGSQNTVYSKSAFELQDLLIDSKFIVYSIGMNKRAL